MKKEKYISPVLSVVLLRTAARIAATSPSGNISDFDNNQLEFEEE